MTRQWYGSLQKRLIKKFSRQPTVRPMQARTVEQTLHWLMAETMAAQETYKEELRVANKGLAYPLNQAVFCFNNALLDLKRARENMFYSITKDGLEIARAPSMREADVKFSDIINEQPEGTHICRNGDTLIIGNAAQGDTETVYKIQRAA